jgi:hypothetical protein
LLSDDSFGAPSILAIGLNRHIFAKMDDSRYNALRNRVQKAGASPHLFGYKNS